MIRLYKFLYKLYRNESCLLPALPFPDICVIILLRNVNNISLYFVSEKKR